MDWIDPSGEFAAAAVYVNPLSYTTPAGWIALTITTLAIVGYEVYEHWDDFGGGVCQAKPIDKNKEPDHPDFKPHKKKRGLQKIPWNKNRKGWPAKDGSYWEPVPDGHKGTHDPHWDQQFPDGSHLPRYPE